MKGILQVIILLTPIVSFGYPQGVANIDFLRSLLLQKLLQEHLLDIGKIIWIY